MSEIKKVLEKLKSQLDENLTRLVPEGLVGRDGTIIREECIFNPPSNIEEIYSLEKELGITIPQDYKDFLLYHDGMTLFKSYLAEFKFFSLNEMRENFLIVQEDCKEFGLELTKNYPIGEFPDVGYIMIDNDKAKKETSKGAIYVNHISPEETNESFVSFVENIVDKTGEFFWEDANLPVY